MIIELFLNVFSLVNKILFLVNKRISIRVFFFFFYNYTNYKRYQKFRISEEMNDSLAICDFKKLSISSPFNLQIQRILLLALDSLLEVINLAYPPSMALVAWKARSWAKYEVNEKHHQNRGYGFRFHERHLKISHREIGTYVPTLGQPEDSFPRLCHGRRDRDSHSKKKKKQTRSNFRPILNRF